MTASMCFSSTTTVRPTVWKMRWAMAICFGRDESPGHRAVIAGGKHRGRVRHRADHGEVAPGRVLDRARLDRRGERKQQLSRIEGRRYLRNDGWNLGRLHAQQNDVGVLGRSQVVRADLHAKLHRKRLRAVGMLHRGDESVREAAGCS